MRTRRRTRPDPAGPAADPYQPDAARGWLPRRTDDLRDHSHADFDLTRYRHDAFAIDRGHSGSVRWLRPPAAGSPPRTFLKAKADSWTRATSTSTAVNQFRGRAH